MSTAATLFIPNRSSLTLPATIADAGDKAKRRYIEFFTANISNDNTRAAYGEAVRRFFLWCDRHGIALQALEPALIAAYIKEHPGSVPTIKQHLAALRMLFDYLVIGQILPVNPAASVRAPRYSVSKGKTPVLMPEDARALLDSLPTDNLIGLRDRALIGLMVYSFARVSAALNMRVSDYYQNGRRSWLRLHEKGGKFHEVPAHHNAEAYIDAYLDAAGIRDDKSGPLFRAVKGRTGKLQPHGLTRVNAWQMVNRRAIDAGLSSKINCHTFRATGITAYMLNGGTLEHAQQIAAHASSQTTKLYDRRADQLTLDEIERIMI